MLVAGPFSEECLPAERQAAPLKRIAFLLTTGRTMGGFTPQPYLTPSSDC
jgi:hypothetical protein